MLREHEQRIKELLTRVETHCKIYQDGDKLIFAIRPKDMPKFVGEGDKMGIGDPELFSQLVQFLNASPVNFIMWEHEWKKN